MPEVQKTVQTGEMTQRFIEFVMMHAHQASILLGQAPNPQTGELVVNLEFARMFIDQLEMIQEKTRGNLTQEETGVLRNALSSLQMAFVEVSGGARPEPARGGEGAPDNASQPEPPRPTSSQPAEQPASGAAEQNPPISSGEPETESRKKFTKSYGP